MVQGLGLATDHQNREWVRVWVTVLQRDALNAVLLARTIRLGLGIEPAAQAPGSMTQVFRWIGHLLGQLAQFGDRYLVIVDTCSHLNAG